DVGVVQEMLVPVGDHRATTVPASPAHDVYGAHRERVGGADHGADVRVVGEVLDRHVQGVPAPVDVLDDRVPRPVAVGVDDVAAVSVREQFRVVSRIRGWFGAVLLDPGTDAVLGLSPLGRARG